MTMQMANSRVQVSSQMRMNFNKILLKTTFDYYNNYKLHCNKMKISSNGHTFCLQDIKETRDG